MNNKRAGLLALIVLGAATLLMVFFVLPRMSTDDKPIVTLSIRLATTLRTAWRWVAKRRATSCRMQPRTPQPLPTKLVDWQNPPTSPSET